MVAQLLVSLQNSLPFSRGKVFLLLLLFLFFSWLTFCAVFQVRDHRATRPNLGTSTAQRHMGWNDRHAAQTGRVQLYNYHQILSAFHTVGLDRVRVAHLCVQTKIQIPLGLFINRLRC